MAKKIFDEEGNLVAEYQKIVDEKVAKLREEKKVSVIYPIAIEGRDTDEKEVYIGYFQQPTFKAFSKYLTASQSNQAVAMRTLAKDCFLDGDIELVDNDNLFLFGLMGYLSKIIEMRNGTLVNLSKPGK